jgi:hypothetical protein
MIKDIADVGILDRDTRCDIRFRAFRNRNVFLPIYLLPLQATG